MSFRTSSVVSAVGHAAFLGWCVLTFTGKPLDAATQSIPVDVISAEQFSQITKGVEKAPQKETPAPLVEKKAEEQKPAPEPVEKVTEKKEIKATAASEPTPPKEEKPPEKKAEKKPDPIAEALKKDEKKPLPPKKEVKDQPKFDASKIAALLDKRAPQRNAATGSEVSNVPSLGAATGKSQTLSQSEIDALRARLAALWNPPAGAKNTEEIVVYVTFRLKRDGTLAGPPLARIQSSSTIAQISRERAVLAVMRGAPFTMLRQETYDVWQELEVKFDPKEMYGG